MATPPSMARIRAPAPTASPAKMRSPGRRLGVPETAFTWKGLSGELLDMSLGTLKASTPRGVATSLRRAPRGVSARGPAVGTVMAGASLGRGAPDRVDGG